MSPILKKNSTLQWTCKLEGHIICLSGETICRSLVSLRKEFRGGHTEEYYSFSFFFIGCTGIWTHGLTFARQMLYHLNYSASPSCIGYFWDRVLLYDWAGLDSEPPIVLHCVAVMTSVSHVLGRCLIWSFMSIFPKLALKNPPDLSWSLSLGLQAWATTPDLL
jgi:hypothetical protein